MKRIAKKGPGKVRFLVGDFPNWSQQFKAVQSLSQEGTLEYEIRVLLNAISVFYEMKKIPCE